MEYNVKTTLAKCVTFIYIVGLEVLIAVTEELYLLRHDTM
jgi:hypothetical protein